MGKGGTARTIAMGVWRGRNDRGTFNSESGFEMLALGVRDGRLSRRP
jgi:hypothetical protein